MNVLLCSGFNNFRKNKYSEMKHKQTVLCCAPAEYITLKKEDFWKFPSRSFFPWGSRRKKILEEWEDYQI